jgi:hypothetical protein
MFCLEKLIRAAVGNEWSENTKLEKSTSFS